MIFIIRIKFLLLCEEFFPSKTICGHKRPVQILSDWVAAGAAANICCNDQEASHQPQVSRKFRKDVYYRTFSKLKRGAHKGAETAGQLCTLT